MTLQRYIIILFLFGLFSCSKSFLEVEPKGKLIAHNVKDYDLLLNNSELINAGGANAQVFMGDEVAALEPFFSAAEPRSQRLFNWSSLVYEPQENALESSAYLRQLYYYNKIINEVPDAGGGTEAQIQSIQAEAMAGRAWAYFMLINYFGKPYDPATAATDPGFPIITASDVTATTFVRAPVKDVYDFIVADLVAAIPNLPAQTSHRIRMSRAAAEGLLGKVYVFMGKFTDALPILNDALAHIQPAAVPIRLIDFNAAFAPGGAFLPLSPFGPTTPQIHDNTEALYGRQFSNFWVTSSELLVAPATMALFKPSDQRLKFFAATPFPFGPEYPAGLMRRMGPLTTSYGVVLPDLILLRAECSARTNDLPGAVTDVEDLRANRMPAADVPIGDDVKTDQTKLLAFILEERIREFACQGARWFDMRRLSVDPLFKASGFTHSLYAEDGSEQVIAMPAERLVMKMPAKLLNENPGMNDNQ